MICLNRRYFFGVLLIFVAVDLATQLGAAQTSGPLVLQGGTLIDATGRPHIEQLATLLDAARSVNNERRHPTDVATLTKRIQRWRKYLDAKVINGRMMFRMSTGNTSSQTEAGDDAVLF